MNSHPGLRSSEVADRVRLGQVNRAPRSQLRDYAQIVARNLINWFNVMVVPAAVALWVLGEVQGAIAVSGMAIVNTGISLIQEIRAKIHLDRLAILVETQARVVRDGNETSIPIGDVVLGDLILLKAGETVVADGKVVEDQFLEIDEALLTGESDPVRRKPGAELLSGSFCVAGEGSYVAEKVGPESFAQRTSRQARAFHASSSPMTRVINLVIQILSYTAIAFCLIYTAFFVAGGFPKSQPEKVQFVQTVAATITLMVPQGFVLTATIAFTLGAVLISRRGAIVQRLHAVESMAAIDVICTDKTGTLTTNRLKVDAIENHSDLSDEALRDRLGWFVATTIDQKNRNVEAIRNEVPKATAELIDQVPFKSQNRYSAVRVRVERTETTLVLGAPEGLRERIELGSDSTQLFRDVEEKQKAGLRVLLFGDVEQGVKLGDGSLPMVQVRPLALIALTDELRSDAGEVLEALDRQGIQFKVLSGDNPETVQGTVRHLDLPWAKDPVLSGAELSSSSDADRLIRERSVFGRIAPEQKMTIVKSLQKQGFHVAMIGDGVNDVLPIKTADLGIAMGEGSQASKTVSGLVLENNNFALLPETLEEGRIIVRNLRRSGKLFLTKNVYAFLLILGYLAGFVPFPLLPQQVTLLNWLVIGIPALAIAVSRERTTNATKKPFLREVGGFAVRTGLVFALCGYAVLFWGRYCYGEAGIQRTLLLATLVLLGISALFRALRDDKSQGNRRFRWIGIAAIPLFAIAMYVPASAGFFRMTPLGWLDWGVVSAVAAVGFALTLISDASPWMSAAIPGGNGDGTSAR